MDDSTRRHWERIADQTIDRAMRAGPPPLWLAGWLLNRCPAGWSRWAPRAVLEAAYRQRYREWTEGM